MKKFFLILLSVVFINALHAQDFIIKKNGDEISAKVQEVGTTEIKSLLSDKKKKEAKPN